jgi:hypothetical protein
MSRRTLLLLLGCALVLVAPARAADVSLSGVDVSGYPTIRLNVVTKKQRSTPPTLRENAQFLRERPQYVAQLRVWGQ